MSAQPTYGIEHYPRLLDLAYQVAQSLKATRCSDSRMLDYHQLTMKLVLHASTIWWLRDGTKVLLPSSEEQSVIYDFASTAVLARVVLETYLTLFGVFSEPTTEDEFEFNHALWQLSGFVVREGYFPADPDLQDEVAYSQQKIQELRARLQNTEKFRKLKSGEQKDVLKGKRRRSWTSVARAAGLGERTIRRLYAWWSGYVHGDGLSSSQIAAAQSPEQQIEQIEIHLFLVMFALSKMILDCAELVPEARAVCVQYPTTFYLAQLISEAMRYVP